MKHKRTALIAEIHKLIQYYSNEATFRRCSLEQISRTASLDALDEIIRELSKLDYMLIKRKKRKVIKGQIQLLIDVCNHNIETYSSMPDSIATSVRSRLTEEFRGDLIYLRTFLRR